MKKNLKPTIVPTVLSQQGTLWAILFVCYFLALLWAYHSFGRAEELRSELDRPVRTPVSLPKISFATPAGWSEYSVGKNWVELRKTPGAKFPFIAVFTEESDDYAYRALDQNPAMIQNTMVKMVRACGVGELAVTGRELLPIKPGVPAMHVIFDTPTHDGEVMTFFIGSTRYAVFGFCVDDDELGRKEIGEFISHLPDEVRMPECREAIRRPVIDSSLITQKENASAQETVARELAMWRLFAARAEKEPDAALLPAIMHFRTAIEKLSAVCEERNLIRTPDFAHYRQLLKIRAQAVKEWFVQLDKQVAMHDIEAAKRQAKFILKHATLVDESLDARRASEILASLNPPPPPEQ